MRNYSRFFSFDKGYDRCDMRQSTAVDTEDIAHSLILHLLVICFLYGSGSWGSFSTETCPRYIESHRNSVLSKM